MIRQTKHFHPMTRCHQKMHRQSYHHLNRVKQHEPHELRDEGHVELGRLKNRQMIHQNYREMNRKKLP